jgi:hypothetical protein
MSNLVFAMYSSLAHFSYFLPVQYVRYTVVFTVQAPCAVRKATNHLTPLNPPPQPADALLRRATNVDGEPAGVGVAHAALGVLAVGVNIIISECVALAIDFVGVHHTAIVIGGVRCIIAAARQAGLDIPPSQQEG